MWIQGKALCGARDQNPQKYFVDVGIRIRKSIMWIQGSESAKVLCGLWMHGSESAKALCGCRDPNPQKYYVNPGSK